MTSTLYVDSLIEKTSGNGVHIPGHVIQVINATTSTSVSTTTTSFSDTSLTATITPKYASSQILILVSQNLGFSTSPDTNAQQQANLVITDGSNNLIFGQAGWDQFRVKEQFAFVWQASLNTSHSPNTTSAFTYKTRFRQQLSNNLVLYTQYSGNPSTITVMEIAQ